MHECIYWVRDTQILSILDANSGYWQIEDDNGGKENTDLTSYDGLYQFISSPFSLQNLPAMFQRVIDVTLLAVKWPHSVVFFDIIAVLSNTPTNHIDRTRSVLHLLKGAGVILKIEECFIFTNWMNFPGHVIKTEKLEMTNHTADAFRKLNLPPTANELSLFLRLCNVSSWFEPSFTRDALPLSKRPRKTQAKKLGPFTEEEPKTMRMLKEKPTFLPVLALPKDNGKFTLDTDTRDKQVAFIRLQKHVDGGVNPSAIGQELIETKKSILIRHIANISLSNVQCN